MKNLLAIISLVALTNCSLPLVGSVGTSTVTGAVTGKYTHSAATTIRLRSERSEVRLLPGAPNDNFDTNLALYIMQYAEKI